ncbi:hypothetical protein V2G26_018329 [Clonostachys chloroleuca]
MSETGQFQSSHAFTRINTSDIESVNPNTGSLNVRIPLVKLVGVRPSIDLNVTVFYAPGSQGIFGLPTNWSLDIPYVLDGKSVTTSGRTFAIDFDWADAKNHKSGLRYVNNHGMTFRRQLPPKPLPSGRNGKYAWYLQHPDGSLDYFDELGRPAERHDVYNNYIAYDYQPPSQGGSDLRTTRLNPTWQYALPFPDGGQSSINYAPGGIGSFVDAESLKTRFEYSSLGQENWQLHSITYPNGLVSIYSYITIPFIAIDGSKGGFPAVQEHLQRDSDGHLQARTKYKYGPSDGCTFTGAAINLRMGGAKDSLMDAGTAYKYEVQKSSHDKDNTELSRTSTWFNTLHLPIKITQFTREGGDRFKDAQVVKLQYPTSGDRRARSAAYDIPISTESFYSRGGSGDSQLVPLQLSKSENNEYCLPLSTRVEVYSTGPSDGYARQSTVSTEYKKTRVGTMIAIKTTQKDEVSQFIQISENTLTPDERDIASTSTSFSEGSGHSPGKPFKLKSLAYDATGRVIVERLSWMNEAQVPEGSAKSSTTKTKYQYSDGKLTVTKLDPLQNATTSVHDVRKANGPVIRTVFPLGETEIFEFDKLGRQISQTDALGHQTTMVHVVGPNGTSVRTTSPLGFSHTTITDVLGREVQTSDNGDETSGKPAARVLSASVYDYQSRVVERVDDLGLRTKHKYDDLGRPTEITDPNGNVVKYTYQKGGLEIEQTLNGDRRSLIHLDGRSKPIFTIRYPDSGAIATEHAIAEEHKYDGRGNIIARAWSQLHNAGKAQVLKKEATEFGVDNAVTSQTTTGYTDAGSDAVQRRFTHDLFGNVYTYIKETWYADGRHLVHHGPIDIYDVANKLVISRNQKGQEERREYDQNLRLSQLVRLDGSKVQYTYDGAGKLKTTKYPVSGTSERSYDADGRQVQISQGSQSIKYSYSLDGVEIGIQYTDGRSQTRILDKHSRTVAEKDFNGNVTKTTFHELGQVARRSCEGDTIEYSYGTTNHTKMQLLGTQQNGQGPQQTTYSYDGHGHVRRTIVKDTRTNKVWMDTTQIYDSLGRVQKTVTASDLAPEVRGERVLEYDGVGQLIKDTRSGESNSSSSEVTRYRYDGNSNVVANEINGKTSTMSFNSIDQRTDAGFEYDANGRLVRDNEGSKYEFDDRDRLITVTQKRNMNQGPSAASQISTYSYSPDDYLSGYKDDTQAVGMYFDGGVASAMSLSPSGGGSVEGGGGEEKEDASIFFDSGSGTPLCTVTKKKSGGGNAETRYMLNQLGSSVVVSPTHSSEGRPSYVAKSYDAYGAPRNVSTSSPSSEAAGGASALLGFTSEFTSPTTSIVYLRARHYNPRLRSFLTMDPRRSLSTPASSSPANNDHHHGSGSTTRVTENRYAYCGGDPVNRIDPTGRSWSWLNDHPHLTMAIGVGVALAVAVLGGLVVEAAVGALAALLPATVPTAVVTFASQFIVGAVSGAAGGLAGSIATGDLDSYTWGTAGLDALGGGMGSMSTTFVQPHFRTLFNSKGVQRVVKAGKLQNFLKWGGRKGVGALVNQGTKKGIPAAEKGLGSVGFGVVIGLEVAKVWADQVTMMDQKGNGSKVAYRGGNTKYEKCGLAYGG